MKLRKDFVVYNMADEYMLIPTGSAMASFGGSVVLNEVSAFILNQMKDTHKSADELLEALLSEYDVDADTARADLQETLETLKRIDVIEA